MTSVSDVVNQVEAAMNDPFYPPDSEEKEVLDSILARVHAGTIPDAY